VGLGEAVVESMLVVFLVLHTGAQNSTSSGSHSGAAAKVVAVPALCLGAPPAGSVHVRFPPHALLMRCAIGEVLKIAWREGNGDASVRA
jgi:hypothetical protein